MRLIGWLNSEATWLREARSTAAALRDRLAGFLPSIPSSLARRIYDEWRRLSLVKRFVFVSTAVVLLGMLVMGLWVSKKIEDGVTRYSAATAALYVDGLIAPLAQELGRGNELSQHSADKIDAVVTAQHKSGSRLVAIKLWKRDGTVAYSTWKELIGKKFKPTKNLMQAWGGSVSAEYDHVVHEDSSIERSGGIKLLEVYSPVLSSVDGRVIAVSEFYFAANSLGEELTEATAQSWLVVGSTTAVIVLALFGLILGANSTIERQKSAMQQQIISLRDLVEQNRDLSERVQRAYVRSTQRNEGLLRRLGSELHDGPAQLLGLALIRLDSLFTNRGASPPTDELEIIRGALQDAMREIRNLSSGFALPHLDKMDLYEVVRLVVRNHEKRTSTSVELDFRTAIAELSNPLKECIYRFLQEALNNSFRHATGARQIVNVFDEEGVLLVQATDDGPGFDGNPTFNANTGLGLRGLKDRVETLGGKLSVSSKLGCGTVLLAQFDLTTITEREAGDA